MTRLALAAVLLLAAGPGPAAEPTPVPDRVRDDLFFLAGDECEGRGLETDGIKRAARHIATVFRENGLKPGGTDGYFQPFPVYTGKATRGPNNTLTLSPADGPVLVPELDADYVPLAGEGPTSAGLVFVGYGISAPKLGYDDYGGLDVAGKWVVMFRRTPRAGNTDRPFDPAPDSPYGSFATKLALAQAKKAAGVMFVNDATYGKGDDKPADPALMPQTPLPVVQIKRSLLAKLLGDKKLADVEAGIDADGKPNSFPLAGWTAAAEVHFTRPSIPCKNVVGVLPGRGPLADQVVVVGAHYDHLGRGEGGRMASRDSAPAGKLHYGADDNASGTTGLLELARRLGGQKDRTGRTVVFIAFSGEERGLFGSLHYCNHPTVPLESVAVMLNMDMIGRARPADDTKTADRLVVYGTGTGTGLEAAADRFNQGVGFDLTKIATGSGPSDHESFFLKKVPVLFFFTGTHRDYHTPADTPDKINLPGLVRTVDYVQKLTEHFAAVPERPKFQPTTGGWYDPTEDKPKKASRGGGPKIGIMPGNYEAADGGVLVEDVVPGGAAEAAGLKKGDRIKAIGGKPVKNIQDYMAAMATQKAGVEVEVQLVRGDETKTVKVTPK